MNSGITDPRDAITLPYRVPQRIVPFGRARRDLRDHQFLHDRLRHPHRVDRIHRLVGGEHDRALDAAGHRRLQDVLSPERVGAQCLQRIELAGGHLLQRRGVKDVVHAVERRRDAVVVADVADVELQLRTGVAEPHVLLLLLVAAEHADLGDVGIEEPVENGVAERARPAGDQKRLAGKHPVAFSRRLPRRLATSSPLLIGGRVRRHLVDHVGPRRRTNPVSARNREESSERSICTVSSGTISTRCRRLAQETEQVVLVDRRGRYLQRAGKRGMFAKDRAHDPRHHRRREPRINRTSIPLDDTPSLRQKPFHQTAGRGQLAADDRTADRQRSIPGGLAEELRTSVQVECVRRIVLGVRPFRPLKTQSVLK